MTRRIVSYGESAVLAELDTLADVLGLHAALEASAPPGVVDIVPAARTVTVIVDSTELSLDDARAWIAATPPAPALPETNDVVTIEVDYSGEDLAGVADLLGIGVDEVVRLHTESVWQVAFGGFALGFGYLVTDHDRLRVPRRQSPRPSVPPGAVGLAGEFSGVYPRSGPGGWQLIGTTDAVLWDADRDPPALFRPGVTVRFRATASRSAASAGSGGRLASAASVSRPHAPASSAAPQTRDEHPPDSNVQGAIDVVAPGPLALIEDLGRPGYGSVGAARSGALDRAAARLGNRLIGNPPDAAVIEFLAGGAQLRFDRAAWFAVTGAWGLVQLNDAPVEPDTAVHAMGGSALTFGNPERGMRYYLAVRGGIDAPVALGSRSRDILTGLGPEPLAAGDSLHLGPEPAESIPAIDTLTVPQPPSGSVTIRVQPGPRIGWFSPDSLERLFGDEWVVSPQSDRIGVRLDPAIGPGSAPTLSHGHAPEPGRAAAGATSADSTAASVTKASELPLRRTTTEELPSEAMVAGAIQVPPSGQPTVLLADHPVTGGYPVVAVVSDASLDAFAQLRPGQRLTFRHAL